MTLLWGEIVYELLYYDLLLNIKGIYIIHRIIYRLAAATVISRSHWRLCKGSTPTLVGLQLHKKIKGNKSLLLRLRKWCVYLRFYCIWFILILLHWLVIYYVIIFEYFLTFILLHVIFNNVKTGSTEIHITNSPSS